MEFFHNRNNEILKFRKENLQRRNNLIKKSVDKEPSTEVTKAKTFPAFVANETRKYLPSTSWKLD